MAKTIGKPIPSDLNSDKNRDINTEALRVITAKGEKIKLGGGKSSIEKHKAKGKLTARERIALLTDEGADFFRGGREAGEIKAQAADEGFAAGFGERG